MIPGGRLASNDVAGEISRQMAQKLVEGKEEIVLGRNGDATHPDSQTGQIIQAGRLAAYQWYEQHPEMLVREKEAMAHFWPDFTLNTYKDGRLFWYGYISPGFLRGQKWYVAALYNANFPTPELGGALHVVPIKPTMREIENAVGSRLHHVIRNTVDGDYICTTRTEDMYDLHDRMYTSAAQTLSWATKWFIALELVLKGDLSLAEFNNPVGI